MSGLVKPKKINIADTNLANFGTDVEKKVKTAAAQTEAAWKEAGKAVGLQIWRIEAFQVKTWPKEQFGSFYDGDSYIVLNTYKVPGQDKLKYNVHFWLGEFTSQDEAGTAAYKTVELDTLLGDEPVQYREVQGAESEEFTKLFPHPIRIMGGGVASGFKHVEAASYKPKLLHVKGKKRVRAVEVPLVADSLNSGDVFVLDNGLEIWVWQGKDSGPMEKNKAGEVARAIDNERGGKPETKTVKEGDSGLEKFWKVLGATPATKVKSAAQGGKDDFDDTITTKKLLRISDASGKLNVKKEAEGKVTKAMLDTKDAFILDVGGMVFVWIGKGASADEKKKGLDLARVYLVDNKRNPSTPIARVLEGGENPQFNAFLDH